MPHSEQYAQLVSEVTRGRRVCTDSRMTEPGDVFIALPGTRCDGTEYIAQALERGARWIIAGSDSKVPSISGMSSHSTKQATLVLHDSPRQALGECAAAHFKTHEHGLTLIGVTGTNGKTSVAFMIEHLLQNAGYRVGMLGTIYYRWPGSCVPASLTTPDCWQVHALLADMAAAGVSIVVMEVSSHAIDQQRLAGVPFDVAVLTNISQDHLDYHKTMEAYFASKSRLFTDMEHSSKKMVINADDPYGQRLLAELPTATGYSLISTQQGEREMLTGTVNACTPEGLELSMRFQGQSWQYHSALIGRYNASNLLAAQGAALALGISSPAILKTLESFQGVPGRLERVPNAHGLYIFVDYAHTPDALENILSTLGELEAERLLVVFGCGGNRDTGKRPLMGQAVCRYADVAVLTSDNPRDEDPAAIIADTRKGMSACSCILEEENRRRAIGLALEQMQKKDVLVIAGKGHETYQERRGKREPFSDVLVARELLA